MFCNIYQWFISGSMDTGKPLPGLIRRHVGHCQSCRRFSEMGSAVNKRLTKDAPAVIEESPKDLSNRIVATLHHLNHSSNKTYKRKQDDLFAPRRKSFSLSYSTAAAVLILVVGFWWMSGNKTVSLPEPGTETSAIAFKLPEKLPNLENSILQLGSSMESPLEAELKSLENAVISAQSLFRFLPENGGRK